MSVTSPCRGRVKNSRVKLNESYPVGAVLGQIEATQEEVARWDWTSPAPAKTGDTDRDCEADANRPAAAACSRPCAACPCRRTRAGASYISPRLKARMDELGLSAADLAGVAGSGAAGRVTVEDFEKFIANLEKQKISQASSMRVAVADAMRRSWTRPLAHVGLPVCLDAAAGPSQDLRAQARPGALRPAGAGHGAGRKQRSRRTAHRQQDRASFLD